jgi:hypothetical protein
MIYEIETVTHGRYFTADLTEREQMFIGPRTETSAYIVADIPSHFPLVHEQSWFKEMRKALTVGKTHVVYIHPQHIVTIEEHDA